MHNSATIVFRHFSRALFVILTILALARPSIAQSEIFDATMYANAGGGEIASGDFNQDGLTDFVFNGANGGISVVLASPGGGFAPPTTFDAGPSSNIDIIAAVDINLDGYPDVAGLRYQAPSPVAIYTYLNNGSGGLQFAQSTPLPFAQPGSLQVHDLTGDGFVDYLVAFPYNGIISILQGDFAGGVISMQNIYVGLYVWDAVPGDPNADGIVDIGFIIRYSGIQSFPKPTTGYVPYIAGTTAGILYGAGGGIFAPPVNFTTANGPGDLLFSDVNADGAADIVTANTYGGFSSTFNNKTQTYTIFSNPAPNVAVLLNNGVGAFGPPITTNIGLTAESILTADLTGDGLADIAYNTPSSTESFGYAAGDGLGNFINPYKSGGLLCRGLLAVDVNGDQRPELIATNTNASKNFVVFHFGSGAKLSIEDTQFPIAVDPRAVAVSDVNADGAPDFAIGNGSSYTISIVAASGPRNYAPPVNYSNLSLNYSSRIAAADFNNDSRPDVVQGTNAGKQYVYLQNVGGAYSLSQTIQFNSSPGVYWTICKIVAADFNSDGSPDLFFARDSSHLYTNDGFGHFTSAFTFPVIPTIADVAAADMNLDGALDIVTNEIAIYYGDGNGAFGPANPAVLSATNVNALVVGDFNNDDTPDIAATKHSGASAGTMYCILRDGFGNFSISSVVSDCPAYFRLETGDLNRDGFTDLIAGAVNSPTTILPFFGDGHGRLEKGSIVYTQVSGDFVVHDLDIDGALDVANIGIPITASGTSNVPGTLAIRYHQFPVANGTVNYGSGTAGCRGMMGLSANSSPQIGNINFALFGTNGPRRGLGVGLIADTQDAAGHDYFFLNFNVLLDPYNSLQLLGYEVLADYAGGSYTPFPLPYDTQLQGLQLFAQQIFVESSADGETCSNGLFELVSSRGLAITIY